MIEDAASFDDDEEDYGDYQVCVCVCVWGGGRGICVSMEVCNYMVLIT